MHVADGVLSISVAAVTTVAGAGLIAYSLKGTKAEEIPKISLLSGAFFVASLINIPIGPTSVHPLLGGFIGLMLGRRAPLSIFVGLILQALLFQHGGISTFGANTILMSLPAIVVYWLFTYAKGLSMFWKGFLAGFTAICIGVVLLVLLLLFSDPRYTTGSLSVIRVVWFAYVPLALLEGVITGFAIKHLSSMKPYLFQKDNNGGV